MCASKAYHSVVSVDGVCYTADQTTGEFTPILDCNNKEILMCDHLKEVRKVSNRSYKTLDDVLSAEELEDLYFADSKQSILTGPLLSSFMHNNNLSKNAMRVLSVFDGNATYVAENGQIKNSRGVQARNYWYGTKKQIISEGGVSEKHLASALKDLQKCKILRVLKENKPFRGHILLQVHPHIAFRSEYQNLLRKATEQWNKAMYSTKEEEV